MYRKLEKYNERVRSLALKSGRPKNSSSVHTESELDLIKRMLRRNGKYGFGRSVCKMSKTGI
mgnify:CR=1 FL=1